MAQSKNNVVSAIAEVVNAGSERLTGDERARVEAAKSEFLSFYAKKEALYEEWKALQLKYSDLTSRIKTRQIEDSYVTSIRNVEKAKENKLKQLDNLLYPASQQGAGN